MEDNGSRRTGQELSKALMENCSDFYEHLEETSRDLIETEERLMIAEKEQDERMQIILEKKRSSLMNQQRFHLSEVCMLQLACSLIEIVEPSYEVELDELYTRASDYIHQNIEEVYDIALYQQNDLARRSSLHIQRRPPLHFIIHKVREYFEQQLRDDLDL